MSAEPRPELAELGVADPPGRWAELGFAVTGTHVELGGIRVKLGEPGGPARFWGLVIIVVDLDALAHRLGERLGAIRDAVQPGRRVATLRPSAGLGPALAFMDPEAT